MTCAIAESVTFQAGTGTANEIKKQCKGLVIALDMGFARERRSCGLAWKKAGENSEPKTFQFGECVKEVAKLVAGNGNGEATLIIEAPLWGLFNSEGNPKERGQFEKARNGTTHRYWYYGSGVGMCFAAFLFLLKLKTELEKEPGEGLKVIIYEGFISFNQDGTANDDAKDAARLLEAFLDPSLREKSDVHTTEPKEAIINLLDLIGDDGGSNTPPAIIFPKKRARRI